MKKNLLFTNHVAQALDTFAATLQAPSVFVLVDVNTKSFVLPRMAEESATIAAAKVITINAGEASKNITTASAIWKELGDAGASRDSLLINLGGGIVTDTGGFAAATFKRGMRFVNIPTTLLAAVDASVGAKTGVNFNNLKNEVGVFSEAELVIVSTTFFRTLTTQDLLAGYAEMLKHALLSGLGMTRRLLAYDITAYDPDTLLDLIRESVEVKIHFVTQDPGDQGLRHALNFGHTFAHAFEALAMKRKSPLSHGYAVAFGMVAALVLSRMRAGFPGDDLHRVAAFVRDRYGAFDIDCDDYPALLSFMASDKKNTTPDRVNFTLLRAPGDILINQAAPAADITAALDIYRDLLGI